MKWVSHRRFWLNDFDCFSVTFSCCCCCCFEEIIEFYLYMYFLPKVRFDPVKMLIIRDDNHFADSRYHYYGSAKTCCPNNGAQCKHTWFMINLSDTGLRLKKQARWVTTGRTQIAKSVPIEKDGMYFVSCKGSCGECRLSDDLSLSIIGCWKKKLSRDIYVHEHYISCKSSIQHS